MRSNYFVYVHFITRYVYNKIVVWYLWPTIFLIIFLVALVTIITLTHIEKQVIQPVQFMAGIAHYLLIPEKSAKHEMKLKRLV